MEEVEESRRGTWRGESRAFGLLEVFYAFDDFGYSLEEVCN